MGGDQLSRSIQDKIKFIPKPTRAAAGIIASNLGGLVHEAQNIYGGRPVLESLEDATNNFVGSLGSLFSKKTSTKILDKIKKYLPRASAHTHGFPILLGYWVDPPVS